MWWVKDHSDHSQGGFQNRDVGKTSFDKDFGPDYGVDFARFSDPPNHQADKKMKEETHSYISENFKEIKNLNVTVRNGFIILEGDVSSEVERMRIEELARGRIEGIREVINQISINGQ